MVRAAASTLLVVLATKDAKLGLIFLDTSRAVKELESILG
jgi:predicted regulator of Ras-like GTPase activity (Roadblock/LC7/MglB family)